MSLASSPAAGDRRHHPRNTTPVAGDTTPISDLPDADDDAEDSEVFDEADDSLHIFTGHTGELYTVACSPTDAQLVATGAGDDKGFLWKIGQGDWAFELQGHQDSVSTVAFSSDGQLVASGSLDGVIQVWDISSRSLKCTLDGPGAGIEVMLVLSLVGILLLMAKQYVPDLMMQV